MHDYLKSGRQAIRLLYFLVIGLALTEAIKRLMTTDGIFAIPAINTSLLFVIFFSFISRFFLGAYRVLSYDIDIELRRGKIVIDSLFLFLQALLFYVFSLSFADLTVSQWMIIVICAVDLVWLVLLVALHGIIDDTFRQWLIHDVGVIVLLAGNLLFWNEMVVVLAVSLIAFGFDFLLSSDFYFAIKTSPGLRIFVAGPYGDYQPAEKIAENVKNAERIGKELALKGHFPFIPHTMLHGWEKDNRFTIEDFKAIDYQWLEYCDALFFIADSPGSNAEKEMAMRKGLQIFADLAQVPNAKERKTPNF